MSLLVVVLNVYHFHFILEIVESLYLSLLQSRLDLRLLCLHCLPGLLQLMDALASLSDLLSQVRDLLCDLKQKLVQLASLVYWIQHKVNMKQFSPS